MGWSFRKSVNLGGGLRLNFSNSGVGASVGVKGLRYGVNARGRHYVQCGMGGIYYRQNLGDGSFSPPASRPAPAYPPASGYFDNTTGPSQKIASAAASGIIDSTSAAFIGEVQKRIKTPAWHLWSLAAGVGVFVLGAAEQLTFVSVLGVIIAIGGGMAGYIFFKKQRTTAVQYDLDQQYNQIFSRLLVGFDQLCQSPRLWHVDTTAAVYNRKYQAGASNVLTRRNLKAFLGKPSFLNVNIKMPILEVGNQSLCFLPDLVLIVQGRSVGAVSYKHLNFACNSTRFIEDGSCPRDSQQVGTTWKFVNKSGGPDRRFSNNRQLPILQYGELKFQSNTGLNEEIQVSNMSSSNAFAQGLSAIMAYTPSGSVRKSPPPQRQRP